jgi:hypothetical protein
MISAQGIEAEILFAGGKKIGADSPVFLRTQKNAPTIPKQKGFRRRYTP